jgi:hypothetical protein
MREEEELVAFYFILKVIDRCARLHPDGGIPITRTSGETGI